MLFEFSSMRNDYLKVEVIGSFPKTSTILLSRPCKKQSNFKIQFSFNRAIDFDQTFSEYFHFKKSVKKKPYNLFVPFSPYTSKPDFLAHKSIPLRCRWPRRTRSPWTTSKTPSKERKNVMSFKYD